MLQQQHTLGRRFSTSKMHLSPPVTRAGVRSKGGGSVVVDSLRILTPIVDSVVVLGFVVSYFCPF